MEKQPAKINYFFKGGYVELWMTVRSTFSKLGKDISDAWEMIAEGWGEFWESFLSAILSIMGFDIEWDEIGQAIVGIFKISFGIGKLIFILIVTTALCLLFSLLHAVTLLIIMGVAYFFFFLWLLADKTYCLLKHIASNCPTCQNRFVLPVYKCPQCMAEHTSLRPGRYGIWKRTCNCGYKLPTTFFNGRGKLAAYCRCCGTRIEDGGQHKHICIPVIGGTSSGKTCFVHQSITAIGRSAADYGLHYQYSANRADDYAENMNHIDHGALPEKTNEMRLKYYQFYLYPTAEKIKILISLCDVGGEVYSDSLLLGKQIGYKNADALLLVMDPLSITKYREEIRKQNVDPRLYGYSSDSADGVIGMLVSTLENVFCMDPKDVLKKDIAVVFSKCDIPGLSEKIGDAAVEKYLREHPSLGRYDAQNAVCENFLSEYEETNFLNSLKSKFRSVQFFCASSLGHNANGTPFRPHGVEDPVLWLIDKASTSIDLKKKWGKRL